MRALLTSVMWEPKRVSTLKTCTSDVLSASGVFTIAACSSSPPRPSSANTERVCQNIGGNKRSADLLSLNLVVPLFAPPPLPPRSSPDVDVCPAATADCAFETGALPAFVSSFMLRSSTATPAIGRVGMVRQL